jgi:hypothetical protein
MNSLLNVTALNRALDSITGRNPTTTEAGERLENARLAKARRPFWLVRELSGNLAANDERNFPMPDGSRGLGFRGFFYGATTDQHQASALFNIVRRRGGRTNSTTESLFTTPQRALIFAGDMNTGANRVTLPDFGELPEHIEVDEDEAVNLQLAGAANVGATNLDNTFFVLRGVRPYSKTYQDAQLTRTEREDIEGQIAGSRGQETRIASLSVDYTTPDGSGYRNVVIGDLGEYALLLGFAALGLDWSTVEISDPLGHTWSNAPIPITALAAVPTDSKQIRYLRFLHPYLVMPRKPPTFSFAKRAATDADEYPASKVEADEGQLLAIYRTV